jgi:hypothetical protein
MRFYNKLKSAMLVAASLFCFHAAFADTALIAWGNCTTDSIEGTSVVNKLVGNEGDTAEGFVLSLTGNPSKTYSAANKLSVPLPNGETGERTTIKLSNGAENTLTLPEGKVATKVTFYSYVNYNVADKGQWGRTSYWASVGGQDYTVETADTLTNWLATKTTYTADEPDARSFELDRVTEIKFKNTGEQPCVVIAVEYEDNAPAVVVNPATLTFNTDTIYVQEGDSTQVQFTYTPDSITWQQAAQLLYGAEPVVSAEPFGIIRYDEETLAIKGYYPGECNLIIELADSAVLIPVVVTAKPAEEEVATSDPINGDWTSIKSWIFEGLADSIYTNKVAATYSTEKVSIANTDCNLGTDEFEGLAFQGADKFFYYNGGLYQGNGGGRKVGVLDVEKGQRVTVVTTDAAFALATTDIAELDTEASSGETFVYNVIADGNLGFTMTRYFVIKSINIEAKTKWFVTSSWIFDNQPDSVYTNKVAATYSSEKVNIAGTDCNLGTGDFNGLAFQGAEKFFYYNGGLYQGNGGGRKVGILGVEAGQRITVVTTDASFALATTDVAELDAEASSGETFVYNVTADGNLGFTMARYLVIKSIQVETQKQLSFTTWQFDNQPDSVYTNKVAATYSSEKVNIAGTDCNLGTDEFEGLAFQGADKFFYYNGGLYQGNGGGRKVGVLNMEAGAVITVVTTDAAFALATTDIAALNSELSSGETFVYNVTADGNVGFTMTRYCVIKSISVVAPKTSKVAAPTAEITKVLGTSREVTLASDNSRAVITYFLGDASEGVVYDAPFNVAESTELRAVAAVGAVVSDTLIMTIEAGTEVQLAGVTYTYGTIADSLATEYEANNLKDIIVHTDQTATLCKPEAKIVYTYKPLDETTGRVDDSKAVTDTVASGTTLYGLGIGQLTAVAVSENYANSEETHLWLKKPAELTEIWSIDFDSLAVAMGASGLEKGGAVTFGAVNFSGKFRENSTCDFAIVQVADSTGNANDSILNANFGVQNETTWLLRAGQGSYWGLYNNNSGDRAFGVCNLLKNQIVHVKFQDASQVTFLYGQAEQDLALTSGNDVYYKATADGMLNVAMNRYYTIHQIGVYQSSDLTNIPTISVVSANNGDRTLEIACTTKGADIFYATATTTDSTTEWSEYIPYTEPITISETTTFKTYATYQDVDSDESEAITVEAGTVISLNEPIIKFVEKTASGKKFEITVDNSELIDSNPQGIYYTLPGAEPVLYSGPFEVADTTYGWMTAISQIEGYEASGLAYRYLDARESYTETYQTVTAESDSLPAEAGDLELADIATLNASLNAAFKPAGRIYMHKTVHAGYNSLVLPFGMTAANLENGTVKVTDETGKTLTRGTDFVVVRIQASTDFATLGDSLAAGALVHTGNLVANTNSYLLKVADELVGHELIFVSGTNAQNLAINKVDLTKVPDEGKWLVKNNATFAPVASEVPVYLVNEEGTALVRQEAGTVVPPYSIAVIAAESFTDEQISLLGSPTGIDALQKDLRESGIVFDLMGRRVTDLKAGNVYFRNGQKFMQR